MVMGIILFEKALGINMQGINSNINSVSQIKSTGNTTGPAIKLVQRTYKISELHK